MQRDAKETFARGRLARWLPGALRVVQLAVRRAKPDRGWRDGRGHTVAPGGSGGGLGGGEQADGWVVTSMDHFTIQAW